MNVSDHCKFTVKKEAGGEADCLDTYFVPRQKKKWTFSCRGDDE
jgi:hypothetical protein